MLFQNMDHIVFAGDSVTDMGSLAPVAEGLVDSLGFGYVRMIENLLASGYPQCAFRITNSGMGGDTSRMLLKRFQTDVLELSPDYISICIGINDVWRQFDLPAFTYQHVYPEEYRDNLTKMVKQSKQCAKGVFLCTPYYMEPNRNDPMRRRMDEYGAICKEIAAEYDCTLVDFQAALDGFFQYRHSSFLAWDRVHPNQIGATLFAKTFLKQCGFVF